VKSEGFKSLWKGNGINVIKIFPMNALNLALKDLFGKYIRVRNPNANKMKFLGASVLSGGLAGACAISVIFPLDFARTRLSTDMASGGKR
jgi:solute carrier family 25 (adenine nucleotide translocator) protein 4/5/6/31